MFSRGSGIWAHRRIGADRRLHEYDDAPRPAWVNEIDMGFFKRAAFVLVVSTLTTLATAVMLAIILAVVDIYLSGHSLPVLARPWIEHPKWGVSMSRADAILLAGATAAGLLSGTIVAVRLARLRR